MKMPFKTGFRVSSPYGERLDPFTGEISWHGGIDLVGNDREVLAVNSGYVINSRMITDHNDRTWEWGNYVCVLGDTDGLLYYYCHLAERTVEAGSHIDAGRRIGIEGATGQVTGVHLHLEIRAQLGSEGWKSTVDPAQILGIQNREGYTWKPDPPYIEQASPWAKDAVTWAVERGILKGRGNDDYALQDPVTREELCVMLYRAREVL